MKVLLQAIITEIVGTDLSTNIGGRLYLSEAPQNVSFPYCVYDLISEIPDEYFSSPDLEEVVLSFGLFSENESSIEVQDLFENLKTVYDNCALTVTGYTHVSMYRTFSSLIRDPENNVWQYNCDYDVMVHT